MFFSSFSVFLHVHYPYVHLLLPVCMILALINLLVFTYYICQAGYVFVIVCLSVCLSVSNFAQKLPNGFARNFREDWQWANEQMIKFWW